MLGSLASRAVLFTFSSEGRSQGEGERRAGIRNLGAAWNYIGGNQEGNSAEMGETRSPKRNFFSLYRIVVSHMEAEPPLEYSGVLRISKTSPPTSYRLLKFPNNLEHFLLLLRLPYLRYPLFVFP